MPRAAAPSSTSAAARSATARAEDAACAACWAPACVFIGIWLACGVRWDVIACLYGWSLLFVLLVHSRAPSALCIATQSLILGTPFLVNAQTMRHEADVPAFRIVFSFCALYVLARALQVIQHRSWYETCSRLTTFCTVDWFVLAAAHDTRAVCFEAQRVFDGSVLRTYLISMAATAAAATAAAAPLLQGVWWGVPQSIVLGLCAMSALFALDAFFRGLWLAAGVRLRSTMNSPWRSTSVSEFWGKRWDRFVRDMLSDLVFKPLRQRGVAREWAVLATFSASAFLHAFPLLATGGAGSAFQAGGVVAYFWLQALAVAVESGWPNLVKRARSSRWGCQLWVLVVVVLPAQLLCAPYFTVSSWAAADGSTTWLPQALSAAVAATSIWCCTAR